MRLSWKEEPRTKSSIAGFSRTSQTTHSAGEAIYRRTKVTHGWWRKRSGDAGARPAFDALGLGWLDYLGYKRIPSTVPKKGWNNVRIVAPNFLKQCLSNHQNSFHPFRARTKKKCMGDKLWFDEIQTNLFGHYTLWIWSVRKYMIPTLIIKKYIGRHARPWKDLIKAWFLIGI